MALRNSIRSGPVGTNHRNPINRTDLPFVPSDRVAQALRTVPQVAQYVNAANEQNQLRNVTECEQQCRSQYLGVLDTETRQTLLQQCLQQCQQYSR